MATDIEYDFVTSLLNDPIQLVEVADISPAVLEDEHWRGIYNVIRNRKGKVAPAILHEELLKNDARFLREFTAGQGYDKDTRSGVDQMFRDGVNAGSARALGDEIREAALVRTVNQVVGQTKREQFATSSDWAMALANKINTTAATLGGNSDMASLQAGVDDAIDHWEFRLDNPTRITGQRVNLGEYDMKMGGLQTGESNLICGHSNEGKSQVLIHMAMEAVQTPHDVTGIPARVAFFSLEMNQRQMSKRFISKIAKVDMGARIVTKDERKRVRDAGELIKKLNADGALTVIDPQSTGNLDQISREMIRQKQVNNITLAFIDYAQLVTVSGREGKYQEIGELSKRLKALALQLDITIVSAAQLNREAMKESISARPKWYHIADGSDLIKSADNVQMIWTPGRHLPATSIGPWKGIAVILTEKRRDGERIPALYYYADFNHSTLVPVNGPTAQELMSEDAQALLNKQRAQTANKYNGATP